jgi:hypothetical protein
MYAHARSVTAPVIARPLGTALPAEHVRVWHGNLTDYGDDVVIRLECADPDDRPVHVVGLTREAADQLRAQIDDALHWSSFYVPRYRR